MLKQTINPQLIRDFKAMVEAGRKVVITCHISPDGDAVGSNLAMYFLLDKLGKEAAVITPDNVPDDMAFLPGYETITSFVRGNCRKSGKFNRQCRPDLLHGFQRA